MKPFTDALKKTCAFVLEEWGMMMVEPSELDKAGFDDDQPFITVQATYQGVFDGVLTVVAQEQFATLLARNVLGLDEDEPLSSEERRDALRELANVVSGNFLVEAFGEETVFDLPAFDISEQGAPQVLKNLGRQLAVYRGDEAPVAFSFTVATEE